MIDLLTIAAKVAAPCYVAATVAAIPWLTTSEGGRARAIRRALRLQ